MPVRLATFAAVPQTVQTVALGDAQFRVRLTWRERCSAWYADLFALDETPIALGRRLTPGWGPLAGLTPPGRPDGFLYVIGPEPYYRLQLGAELHLMFATFDELPAVVEADAPRVEIT